MGKDFFSEEELMAAKEADLCEVARQLGYTVKKKGNYHTLAEMDSIMIYNRRSWCRWSRITEKGENGGSQIDFLRVFAGMEVKDAVFWLLDFTGYQSFMPERKKIPLQNHLAGHIEKPKKPFLLPVPARNNDILFRYLTKERAISVEVVDFFVRQGLLYEERRYHNIVFKGKDKNGTIKFASMRGVCSQDSTPFKCDVAGSNKQYGFHIWNGESRELYVFEAAIDLISFVDMYRDYDSNKLALGMLHDAPLATFLKEHTQIRNIHFCLDNDVPGRKALQTLCQKYYGLGYEVEDCLPPEPYKDYNEWLVAAKKYLSVKKTNGRLR